MAIDTHEILYIKALDNYPYDVEECIDKLQYVISANYNHVGAHYLLGRIHQEQLKDYAKARFHYQMALSLDHTFTPIYGCYIGLLIDLNAFEDAQKTIEIGITIPGIDIAYLACLEGILYEKQELFKKAKKLFKNAKIKALDNEYRSFLDEQLDRIKAKEKELKPSKVKKAKKKSKKKSKTKSKKKKK